MREGHAPEPSFTITESFTSSDTWIHQQTTASSEPGLPLTELTSTGQHEGAFMINPFPLSVDDGMCSKPVQPSIHQEEIQLYATPELHGAIISFLNPPPMPSLTANEPPKNLAGVNPDNSLIPSACQVTLLERTPFIMKQNLLPAHARLGTPLNPTDSCTPTLFPNPEEFKNISPKSPLAF